MFWKKWPYWVRGGVIAEVIPLVTFIFYLPCFNFTTQLVEGDAFYCFFSTLPATFPVILFEQIFPLPFESDSSLLVMVPVAWFLLGSLIGAIIGKFKKKPNVSQMSQV